MKPPCRSLARRTKSGSSFMNVYSAMAATLDRSAMTIAPSGAIEPVETLSGRTIRTCPVMSSGSGGGIGGGLMLGPRMISIRSLSAGGAGSRIMKSSTSGSGSSTLGGSPSVRGSVIRPCSPVAAVVAGGVGVGAQLDPLVLAALAAQEAAGLPVGREDRGRPAELGDHVADRRPPGHRQVRGARTGELEDAVEPALDRVLADEPQDQVLGGDPGRQLTVEVHADHDRGGHPERLAGHGERDLQPARADGDRPARTRGGRVRVGAEQGGARPREALGVDLVADAVARPREPDAVLGGERLQEQVVVGVAMVELQHVVVDVLHREVDLHLLKPECLELHAGHRAGRVLQQRLVDPERDLLAGNKAPLDHMLLEDLARHGAPHARLPRVRGVPRSPVAGTGSSAERDAPRSDATASKRSRATRWVLWSGDRNFAE